jgi:hypothetical protein
MHEFPKMTLKKSSIELWWDNDLFSFRISSEQASILIICRPVLAVRCWSSDALMPAILSPVTIETVVVPSLDSDFGFSASSSACCFQIPTKSLCLWDPDWRSWAAGRHLHLNKLCGVCGQTTRSAEQVGGIAEFDENLVRLLSSGDCNYAFLWLAS